MATLLLPSTLDAATLPVMIASLDRLVYPKPTNGFTARMAVLLALSGLCVLPLLLLRRTGRELTDRPLSFSQVHDPRPALPIAALPEHCRTPSKSVPVVRSARRPAQRALHRRQVRRLELLSAVTWLTVTCCSPRMAWVGTVFFYGCFELLVICTFWRVYQLGHGQRLWIGVRSFTALVMFSCGWIIAWAGLTVRPRLSS